MKAISKVVVAGLVSMVLCSGSAKACGNRCYVNPNVQPNLPFNTFPQPIQAPTPSPNGLSLNDTVVNDLPADAKRAIKAAAAKSRANVRQVSNSRPSTNARSSP